MSIRCKFRCDEKVKLSNHEGDNNHKVRLTAIHSPDVPGDQAFCDATPSGCLDATINNPVALDKLVVGNYYHIDITPCVPGH